MSKILKSQPVKQLMQSLGAAIKAHVEAQGSVKGFILRSGVSRNSLYRLFNGDVVGVDLLLIVLQTLGRVDLLEMLTEPPSKHPMEMLKDIPFKSRARKYLANDDRVQLIPSHSISGLATPRFRNKPDGGK